MTNFILRRLLISLFTLLVVSMVVFGLSRLTGNPVDMYLDVSATEEDRQRLARALGLDQPVYVQYAQFLQRAVLEGDLGRSYIYNLPVMEVFLSRFGATLRLGFAACIFALAISLPVGILAAVHRNSGWDWFARSFVFLGQALPSFWMGIMLILIFAVRLNLVPPAGNEGLISYILPAVTLGWAASAGITRMVRASMLEVLSADYIRTARGKGLAELMVVWRHALKNTMIPTVAYASVVIVRSFVIGSIVVETVFGWPGIGRLAYEATFARDFPLIQGIVVIIAVIVILVNLGSELLYGWLDPRIRYA